MTREFFAAQMQILIRDFGSEQYTPSKVEAIWEICQDLPDKSFAEIIKHFIWTKPVQYPPLPTHFNEEAHIQRKLVSDGLRRNQHFQSSRNSEPERTGEGLKKILDEYGATNVVDAISKFKAKKRNG